MKFSFRPHFAIGILLSISLLLLPFIPINAQSPGASTVRGRVVFADNGQPLKSSRVEIFSSNDPSGNHLTTTTNDRGEFQIEKLVAGKYYVTVVGPGVSTPSGFGMRIPLPIAAIPRAEDYPEIVPKHDAVFDVDGSNTAEIEVRVPRGGSLSGKVMKADGSPVADVAVSLISKVSGAGPYTARFSSRTNQKGVYKFENVLAGDYLVSAATEAKNSNFDIRARLRGESQIATFHPAAVRLADALTVKVDPGRESTGIIITLVERKTLSASGSLVRARDGSPVAGAIVILRNKESQSTGPLMPGMSDRRTETSTDGKWYFGNVSPGDYEVTALTPTGPTAARVRPVMGQPGPRLGRPPVLGRMDPGPRPQYLMTQQQISLVSANVSDLTLVIGGAGRIRGLVETENGEMLPNNVTLFFEFLSDGPRPGRPEPVRVQPDGSFLLENVASGERRMMAGVPNGSPYFIVSTTAGDKDLSETPLEVVEDAEAGTVRVRISSRFATVSGTVGGDIRSGNVVVLLVPVETAKQRFRIAYTAVQTAANGSFMAKVAPGKYLILARRRDDLPPVITPDLMGSIGDKLETLLLLPDEQKTIQLRIDQR